MNSEEALKQLPLNRKLTRSLDESGQDEQVRNAKAAEKAIDLQVRHSEKMRIEN